MNFYEFYQLLNENTVSQELKKIKSKYQELNVEDSLKSTKQELKAAFLNLNINDKNLTALAKWIVFDYLKNVIEKSFTGWVSIRIYSKMNSEQKEALFRDIIIRIKNKCGDYLAHNLDNSGNFNAFLLSKFNDLKFDINSLIELSHQYHEDLKKQRGNIPGEPGKTILSFPDGYKWVNLNKDYCEREGRAGLHCGNIGRQPGDTILSLRDSRDHVYLTFILNDGMLVERKGRQNLKPKKEYHPYIIELLKLPIIKGLGLGRYDPKNDFQLSDLSQEQIDKILKMKPEFEKSLFLNYFNNFTLNQKFNSRLDMIEKIKSLESGFPTQIKRELSLVLKYTYEHIASRTNIDEIFSEDELLEILSNKKIIDLDNSWTTEVGERLNIIGRIAHETKNEKVQKEIFKNILLKEKPNSLIQGFLNNPNLAQDLSKKMPETIEALFWEDHSSPDRMKLLSDPRMPEKVLRQVAKSEMRKENNVPVKLVNIAENPKCPSDLLDELSHSNDEWVLSAVINNKNTKFETLKNLLERIEDILSQPGNTEYWADRILNKLQQSFKNFDQKAK